MTKRDEDAMAPGTRDDYPLGPSIREQFHDRLVEKVRYRTYCIIGSVEADRIPRQAWPVIVEAVVEELRALGQLE